MHSLLPRLVQWTNSWATVPLHPTQSRRCSCMCQSPMLVLDAIQTDYTVVDCKILINAVSGLSKESKVFTKNLLVQCLNKKECKNRLRYNPLFMILLPPVNLSINTSDMSDARTDLTVEGIVSTFHTHNTRNIISANRI